MAKAIRLIASRREPPIEDMPKIAAGIALYRITKGEAELFVAHLGGPYFAKKDRHGWVVPKGIVEPNESILRAAEREWTEETGNPPPQGQFVQLAPIRQSGNKLAHLFAVAGDIDPADCRANEFELEWPPRSGLMRSFPELDRYAWIPLSAATEYLVKGLAPLPDLLFALIAEGHTA